MRRVLIFHHDVAHAMLSRPSNSVFCQHPLDYVTHARAILVAMHHKMATGFDHDHPHPQSATLHLLDLGAKIKHRGLGYLDPFWFCWCSLLPDRNVESNPDGYPKYQNRNGNQPVFFHRSLL